MALKESTATGQTNPRSDGPNIPAGAIKANEIRGQIQNWNDPYLRDEEQPGKPSLCTECGAVWSNHRWYMPDDAPVPQNERGQLVHTLCPADRRKRDRVPGGVVTVAGGFFHNHKSDIEDLIRNEEKRAMKVNPMERIMEREHDGETLILHTTNPRLAQRLGHALEKAYHGHVDYKWSGNDTLARVDWSRDA